MMALSVHKFPSCMCYIASYADFKTDDINMTWYYYGLLICTLLATMYNFMQSPEEFNSTIEGT